MKAFNLLYGRRKRGPGPKPVDAEALYTERLEGAIARGEGGIDADLYNWEIESVDVSEIIVFVEDFRDHYAARITAEPTVIDFKPTYPIDLTIESCEFEDDMDRWRVSNREPGKAQAQNSRNITIDCADYAAAGMAEVVLRELVIPAIEELA